VTYDIHPDIEAQRHDDDYGGFDPDEVHSIFPPGYKKGAQYYKTYDDEDF
jgi:hypothetical protein